MKTVLIIDDEEKLRSLLSRIIRSEGFEVIEAIDGKSALKKADQYEIDVVLCDVKLPDINGIELIRKIREKSPETEIILLTAYGKIADGVQAMKNGAFDYIVKGDDNEKIIPLLNRAIEKSQLQKRVKNLEARIGQKFSFDSIIGRSKVIQHAIDLAKKVAPTGTTVLLLGETGTGKEVFAQSIHYASSRSSKPFVAVNCSAFTKELLENELFGHKAGAFTGAVKDSKGLFEEANEGTIFLDEIGEIPLEIQAKLLRVLETGEFHKIGDTQLRRVNVRIIAATNRDLEEESKNNRFRQDLFYRLSVFQVTLPPLRERVLDIEPLAQHFIKVFSNKQNKKIPAVSPGFIEALKQYQWPGNIRELKNMIERCIILCDNELIPGLLPADWQKTSPASGKILSAFELASAEKLHIQKVLNYTNGNKTETAKLLNIALTTLYRKLEEYKIS